MKISGKRIELAVIKKISVYILVCYLLASWSVNGVLHPMHYIRSVAQQAERLSISEEGGDIVIGLPEKAVRQQYLSFQVAESEDYFFSLELTESRSDDTRPNEAGSKWVEVNKGWNTIDISDCPWEQFVVPCEMAQQEGLVLKDAVLSEHRMVDFMQAAYVFAAFLVLVSFWECVGWIKKRYAQ